MPRFNRKKWALIREVQRLTRVWLAIASQDVPDTHVKGKLFGYVPGWTAPFMRRFQQQHHYVVLQTGELVALKRDELSSDGKTMYGKSFGSGNRFTRKEIVSLKLSHFDMHDLYLMKRNISNEINTLRGMSAAL